MRRFRAAIGAGRELSDHPQVRGNARVIGNVRSSGPADKSAFVADATPGARHGL